VFQKHRGPLKILDTSRAAQNKHLTGDPQTLGVTLPNLFSGNVVPGICAPLSTDYIAVKHENIRAMVFLIYFSYRASSYNSVR